MGAEQLPRHNRGLRQSIAIRVFPPSSLKSHIPTSSPSDQDLSPCQPQKLSFEVFRGKLHIARVKGNLTQETIASPGKIDGIGSSSVGSEPLLKRQHRPTKCWVVARLEISQLIQPTCRSLETAVRPGYVPSSSRISIPVSDQ